MFTSLPLQQTSLPRLITGEVEALIQTDKTNPDGAVYFGWLGFIVGAIAILQNHDFQNVGPAVAINILPVFYGYLIRWVLVPFCVSFLKRKIKNDEINS